MASERTPSCRVKAVRRQTQADAAGPFPLDAVYPLDCVEAMRQLPARCVDLILADPPYNASKGSIWKWDNSVPLPGFGGNWAKVMSAWDDMPLAEYLSFTLSWLAEVQRVLRPSGSIWIHGTYHNIGIINFALQLLEIEIINEVIWYKRNSFPNLSGRRLTASHETILWAHAGGPRSRQYLFHYEQSKQMACPEDCLKEPGRQMRTVWDIPNNKGRDELAFGKHPTQKPLRLLTRMLQLSASPGNLLLVPFAGAGSECVAAKRFGLRFLGFETDKEYLNICRKRLEAEALATAASAAGDEAGKKSSRHAARSAPAALQRARAVPSLIKWTGSKRSQAAAIAAQMPEYRRYFEPFLGGGALLFLAGVPRSVAGDIYEPLVQLWRLVQCDPQALVADYCKQWHSLQQELQSIDPANVGQRGGFPRYYYRVRDRFNERHSPLDLNFLMRTCVNGIVRFNEDGRFNNSFHLSRSGMTPERFERTVQAWHQVVQNVTFLCQDYSRTIALAEKGDFVYFDPPYAGNRQRYIQDLDLDRFFAALEDLNRRQVHWALSFDGRRGSRDMVRAVPKALYRRRLLIPSGNSAVGKVLNGPVEPVEESLYLNY